MNYIICELSYHWMLTILILGDRKCTDLNKKRKAKKNCYILQIFFNVLSINQERFP